MSFSATAAGVALPDLDPDIQSVDVRFGDDRVWSIDLTVLPSKRPELIEWPVALKPYLVGTATVVLVQSGSGRVLATEQARFTDAEVATRVLDDSGVPLAVNKWGRLGKTLEAGNPGVQERILERTEEVMGRLTEMGLRPFVVGGTLLGGVRDQALLPHDDDADVAYLSRHRNPLDVAAEGFTVGRKLEALGYELVRHSATHMQLYFRDSGGGLDYYVDVFTAFFTDDGHINQPFHVRGEMREDQMLPFGEVEIQGRMFPAPADAEAWLVINYDENWRTPIPGYRLHTPRSTVRRFQNWFGSFHYTRDFWNDHYRTGDTEVDEPWASGRDWILAHESALQSRWLVDLGTGAGVLAAELRDRGAHRTVVAADYSPNALALASTHGGERLAVVHTNLYRNLSLAMPVDAGIDGPFDLVANHLIQHLGPHAFPQAMRLIRMALRSGGRAYATLYGEVDVEATHSGPMSWAMPPEVLQERAADYGLRAEIFEIPAGSHESLRAPYGVRFSAAHVTFKEKL
ncbi:class I SAM-dependent methyltransferase [Leucobacter sp. G161]|uniref:class I SAM-dependent methyltransferase n=1 Tax=Leucobacter sp. G161 TaxID=663704 RepID=UPI00073BA229|nr:class I SAM-dependent methyltransferase [Leucobacter sp. G161]KUF08593.1 hypothetical protein AUL38_00330 [Leucobacter sp. G161]